MTHDPLTAALDQLAAHHEQLSALDAREARHFASLAGQLTQLAGMITAIGHALRDDTAALARIEAIEHKLAELAASLASPADGDGTGGYQPGPAPAWWQLSGAERQEAAARLRAWVTKVHRPGYGHLAVTLGPCWEAHDLCLYGLDILSQLWQALYLQPARSAGLLSAQAEYQARILPAIAAQLMAETTGCGHDQARRQPPDYARSLP
jgi:hypothetical protein